MARSRARSRLLLLGGVLVFLVILFLVVGSPFALNLLTGFSSNWSVLSNIGQTYGAISALLAAMGLAGVVVTIFIQVNESRRDRADVMRSRHFDLYRMAMDDPSLTEISHSAAQRPVEERRVVIYTNFQLEYWRMLWEIHELPASTLRGYAEDMFRTQPGRTYWKEFGVARKSLKTGGRRERSFLRILDEEYEKASEFTVSGSPRVLTGSSARDVLPGVSDAIGAAALAVLCASIVRWFLRRRDRS